MRTEQIDPRYADLDSWSAAEMIAAMYEGQLAAAGAVRSALGLITSCRGRGARAQARRTHRLCRCRRRRVSRCRTEANCRQPMTGRLTGSSLLLPAVLTHSFAASKAEDNEAAAQAITARWCRRCRHRCRGERHDPFTIAALRAAHAAGA
jgi:N-acetylmuramic acid 6-phosphate etherase